MIRSIFVGICAIAVIVGSYYFYSSIKNSVSQESDLLRSEKEIISLEKAVANYKDVFLEATAALAGEYDALLYLGIQLAENGGFSECVNQLKQAYALRADDVMLYYYLGLCYTNLARTALESDARLEHAQKAEQSFKVGLALEEDNELLNYGLGILYGFVLKDTKEAQRYLQRSYEKEPYDVNVIFALANISFQQDNHQLSRHYYREIMDKTLKNSAQWEKAEENLRKLGSR